MNQGNRVPARRVVRIAAKVDLGKRARQSRGWTNIATGHVNALHARFRQFPFAIRAIMHANHGFSTYEKHGPDVVHRYEPHRASRRTAILHEVRAYLRPLRHLPMTMD